MFIKEAFKKGASLAIVNKINKSETKSKQIKVDNSLKFLTKTSKIIRKNSFGKMIAITGSCGKTSLKELLGKTLNKISRATYSPKSYNNKFGVPLSLFNLDIEKDDFGVFEVGMDKKGEIDNLTKIIKPDVGVITNVSYAHIKNFKNIREIAYAKSEIINNIKMGGSIVLNADDQFYNLHKKIALRKKLKVCSFSINKKSAHIRLNSIKKYKSKFKASISIGKQKKYFFIQSNFESNLKNFLASIAVISIFKDIKNLNKNIFYNFKNPIGRGDISSIKVKNKKFFLIDESYNSNPLSLTSAIKNFDKINHKSSKKHLLLGDMLELGKHSKKLHEKVANIINSSKIDNVYAYGKNIKYTFKKIVNKKKGYILRDKKEIISLIKNNININDYLMIKGSNSTGLYKLVNYLKKGNISAL